MKLTQRFISLAVCVMMIISCCMFASAESATVTITSKSAYSIDDAVDVTKYDVSGSVSGHTEEVTVMEFNPADGYIPMAFTKYGGSAARLDSQYTSATTQYGYEVAGLINGAYFSTADGTLVGTLISDGKIHCAHSGYESSFVTFDSEGKMTIVDKSKLEYMLFLNGQEMPNGLYYINKHHHSSDAWTDKFYYYDSSCGTIADLGDAKPGYVIICEKTNNTELSVGGTLYAKVDSVVELTEADFADSDALDAKITFADSVPSNKFLLYVQNASGYVKYVKDLKAGDSVSIAVEESIEAAREAMTNANSVIDNIGFLVKDGVDQTNLYTDIGDHSVTDTYARWTAFGIKEDGTYVFLTSAGASTGASARSLTLKDVAAMMMELGCKDVIRLDGGGSTAMYVSDTGAGEKGYLEVYEDNGYIRAVADCILVVKQDSIKDATLEDALKAKIDELKAGEVSDELASAIAEAEALLAQDVIVSGDVQTMLNKLDNISSGKGDLLSILATASGISFKDYKEETLTKIRASHAKGMQLFTAGDASPAEIKKVIADLTALLEEKSPNESTKAIFVTGFNRSIGSGDCNIFTTDCNGGVLNGTSANHLWTYNVVCKYDETIGKYVVTRSFQGTGASTPTVTLTEGEIMIAAHEWEATVPGSGTNKARLSVVKVGQVLDSFGIDLDKQTTGVAAYLEFNNKEDSVKPVLPPVGEVGDKPFWITHFNDLAVEGAGVIITNEGLTGGSWNNFYAFAPVEGTYAYEIVAVSLGIGDGKAKMPAIPEGGFVYSINVGNDYPSINIDAPNYTSENCNNMVADVANWTVGTQLVLYGFTVDGGTIPTSTPGVNWYDPSYVCTATYSVYEPETEPDPEPTVLKGDVDANGEVDQFDYLMVKRAYFKTYNLDEEQSARADVDGNGVVDQFDYVIVKRIYFKTYKTA